jgi:hypothetical protein
LHWDGASDGADRIPIDEELRRVALGIYNSAVKPSHAYGVIRNPGYVVGDDFPFQDCHAWLKSHSDWLNTPDAYCNVDRLDNDANKRNEQPVPDAGVRKCSGDLMDSTNDTFNADDDVVVPRSRPEGNKSAKRARRTSSTKQQPDDKEADTVGSALSAWTAAYRRSQKESTSWLTNYRTSRWMFVNESQT